MTAIMNPSATARAMTGGGRERQPPASTTAPRINRSGSKGARNRAPPKPPTLAITMFSAAHNRNASARRVFRHNTAPGQARTAAVIRSASVPMCATNFHRMAVALLPATT